MKYGIFPCGNQNYHIIDTISSFRPDMEISFFIKPNAWKLTDDGQRNILFTKEWESHISQIDGMIFLSSSMHDKCLQMIKTTLSYKKHVICSQVLSEQEKAELTEFAQKQNVTFCYLANQVSNLPDWIISQNTFFHPQESIVIGFGSLTQNLDSGKLIPKVALHLQQMGYRVSCISPNPDLQLLGFDPLPMEQFTRSLPYSVYQLNHYFEYLEQIRQPDIFLVEFPHEGMINISNEITHGFGIQTHLISEATIIDYFVLYSCCHPNNDMLKICQTLYDKYNLPIQTICITDNIIDTSETIVRGEIRYSPIPYPEQSDYTNILKRNLSDKFLIDSETSEHFSQRIANHIIKTLEKEEI